MKIFNWVHSKLSNKGGGSTENAEKIIVHENNIDSNINVFDQLLGGGILTIGTFGYDPLKEPNEENGNVSSFYKVDHEKHREWEEEDEENDQTIVYDTEFEEVENEEEGGNPFVFAAYQHDYSGLIIEGIINENKESCYYDYVMMEKKERITLADLFSAADSHAADKNRLANNKKSSNDNVKSNDVLYKNEMKKAQCTKKHGGRSKAITEDARPIRKLQQMVRRILKRKVHPNMSLLSSNISEESCETNDHAFLLPTGDGTTNDILKRN